MTVDATDRDVDRFVFMDRSEHWVVVRGMAEVTIGSKIRTIHAAV
jgi:mannose-6-phosphate isomerase-like protein (cupin superfamily)